MSRQADQRMLDDLDVVRYRMNDDHKKELKKLEDRHMHGGMDDEDMEKLERLHDRYC